MAHVSRAVALATVLLVLAAPFAASQLPGTPTTGEAQIAAAVDSARAAVLAQVGNDPAKQDLVELLAEGLEEGIPEGLPTQPDSVVTFVQLDATEILQAADTDVAGDVPNAARAALAALAEGHMAALLQESVASTPAHALTTIRALDGGLFSGFVEGFAADADGLDAADSLLWAEAWTHRTFDDLDALASELPPGPGASYLASVEAWATAVARENLERLPRDATAAQVEALAAGLAALVDGGVLGLVDGFPEPRAPIAGVLVGLAEGTAEGFAEAFDERPRLDEDGAWQAWLGAVPASLLDALGDPDLAPDEDQVALVSAWAEGLATGTIPAAAEAGGAYTSDLLADAQALAAAVGEDATTALADSESDPDEVASVAAAYGAAIGAGLPLLEDLTGEARDVGEDYLEGLAAAVADLPTDAVDTGDAGALGAFLKGAVEGGLGRLDGMSAEALSVVSGGPLDAYVQGVLAGLGTMPDTGLDGLEPDLVEAFAEGLSLGYLDEEPTAAWATMTFDNLRHTSAFVEGAVEGMSAQFVVNTAWTTADAALVFLFSQSLGPLVTEWARGAKTATLDQVELTGRFANATAFEGLAAVDQFSEDVAMGKFPTPPSADAQKVADYLGVVATAAQDLDAATAWATEEERQETLAAFAAVTAHGVRWVLADAGEPARELVRAARADARAFTSEGRLAGALAIVRGVGDGLPPREIAGGLAPRPGVLLPWVRGVLGAVRDMPPEPTEETREYWTTWIGATTGGASQVAGEATGDQVALAEEYAGELTAWILSLEPPGRPGVDDPLKRWAEALVAGPLRETKDMEREERLAVILWLKGLNEGGHQLLRDLDVRGLPADAAPAVVAFYDGAAGAVLDVAGRFVEIEEPCEGEDCPCPETECPPPPDPCAEDPRPPECEEEPPEPSPVEALAALAAAFADESFERLVNRTVMPRATTVAAWANASAQEMILSLPDAPQLDEERVEALGTAVAAGMEHLPTEEEARAYADHVDRTIGTYAGEVAAGAADALFDGASGTPGTPGAETPTTPTPPSLDDPFLVVDWVDAVTDPLFQWPQKPDLGAPPDVSRVDRFGAYARWVVFGGVEAAIAASEAPALGEAERADLLGAWAEGVLDAAVAAVPQTEVDAEAYASYLAGVASGGVTVVVENGVALAKDEPEAVQAYATFAASWVVAETAEEEEEEDDDGDDGGGGTAPPDPDDVDPTGPWETFGKGIAEALLDLPVGPLDERTARALETFDGMLQGLSSPPTEPTAQWLAYVEGWLRAEAGSALAPPTPAEDDLEGEPSVEATQAFVAAFTEEWLWSVPPDAPPFADDEAAEVEAAVHAALQTICAGKDVADCAGAASVVGAALQEVLANAPDAPLDDVPETARGVVLGLEASTAEARDGAVAAALGALGGGLDVAGSASGQDTARLAAAAEAAARAAGDASGALAPTAVEALARATAEALVEAAGDPDSFPATAEAVAAHVVSELAPDTRDVEAEVQGLVDAWMAGDAGPAAMNVVVTTPGATLSGAALDGTHWTRGGAAHRVTATPPAALRVGDWKVKWVATDADGKPSASGSAPMAATPSGYEASLAPADLARAGDGATLAFVLEQSAGGQATEHQRDGRPFAYKLDVAAPAAAATAPATSATPAFRVSWSATDGASGVAGVDVEVRAGAGEWRSLLAGTDDDALQYTGADGARYEFRVRATDEAGNVGAWSASAAVSVDTPPGTAANRAPTVAFTEPASGAEIGRATDVRLAVADPDGTAPMVTVTLRSAEGGDGETVYSGSGDAFTLDPAGRRDGKYELVAVATDGALASAPAQIVVLLDRGAPDIKGVLASPVDAARFLVTARVVGAESVALEVAPKGGSPAESVQLRDDGSGDDAHAGDGVWTAGVEARAGTYDLRIVARDADGHEAVKAVEQTFLAWAGATGREGEEGPGAEPTDGADEGGDRAPMPFFAAVLAAAAAALLARRRRA